MTYSYKTPLGTFVIRSQRTDPRRVELWVGDECYGSYASARMAASDVYAHATGYSDWDMAGHLEVPEDLGEWQQS
jgi:hypothetical protein